MLRQYRAQQVTLAGVTVSSDAYGSLPVFDERGQLIGYDVADPGGQETPTTISAEPCASGRIYRNASS